VRLVVATSVNGIVVSTAAMMSTYLMGALPSKGLTTQALTDIIDTERSTRLEADDCGADRREILIAFYELFFRLAK